jgi:hypothetical protein
MLSQSSRVSSIIAELLCARDASRCAASSPAMSA